MYPVTQVEHAVVLVHVLQFDGHNTQALLTSEYPVPQAKQVEPSQLDDTQFSILVTVH